jgi:AbrB family looped-hinge helix DNA binding protein
MKIITVTTKGQMVIPSEIRKKLAINPGVKLNIEIIDSKIVLSVSDIKARLSTFRKKVRQNLNSQKIIKISDEQINLAKSNLWKQRES